jgi:CheY-like chemotaxis protein
MKEDQSRFKYNFIMLLDDDDIANFLNRKLIDVCNFSKEVQVNNKPLEALAFVKQLVESNSANYPEVFFIDLNMPVMNGFEFLEQLKNLLGNKFNESKIAVLTSSVDPSDKNKVTRISQNVLFFNKPLTEKMLDSI